MSNYISQLKAILARGKFSQTVLAQRLGITFAALNRWINGHAVPRPSRILAIERLYREQIGFPGFTEASFAARLRAADRLREKNLWDRIAGDTALQDLLILEHTYNSNAIEGSTLSKKETEAVIFDKSIIRDKTLIEHLETVNHAALLRSILAQEFKEPITEPLIKTFHARLMQGIRHDAGRYSKHQRAIRGVDILLTHPEDIPEEIAGLIKTWKKEEKSPPSVKKIADFHVAFESIHPFGDGNGRVGRLIMVAQCLRYGYPPVLVENDRKAEYYDVLEFAQRRDSRPFAAFICDEMERTKRWIRKKR